MKIFRNIRVLEVNGDKFIGVAPGYRLYEVDIESNKRKYLTRIRDNKWATLSRIPLVSRLLRAEITRMYTLANGDWLFIGKKSIYKVYKDTMVSRKVFDVPRGSRPRDICVTPQGDLYFGEYFLNWNKEPLNVYHSTDNGETWSICYTFPKGSINHVHNIMWDPYSKKIWIITGDRENECLIANTTDGFKTLNIVFRGAQPFRTCDLLFYPDYIVYATDSEYEKNHVKVIDRKNLSIREVQELQSSVTQGTKLDDMTFVATSAEPSKVNESKHSYIWASKDGKNWKQIFVAEKDMFHPTYFQFGALIFPRYISKNNKYLVFAGQALKGLHRSTVAIPLKDT